VGSHKVDGAAKGRLYAIATQSTGQADQLELPEAEQGKSKR